MSGFFKFNFTIKGSTPLSLSQMTYFWFSTLIVQIRLTEVEDLLKKLSFLILTSSCCYSSFLMSFDYFLFLLFKNWMYSTKDWVKFENSMSPKLWFYWSRESYSKNCTFFDLWELRLSSLIVIGDLDAVFFEKTDMPSSLSSYASER